MLPLIYIIIVANSLVASEVDRGSMAYTLSTPIERKSVVFTKAVALIGSLVLMFVITTGAGLFTTQIAHGAVWGTNYTADVKAVAKELDMEKADVADDLSLILNNEQALKTGAEAREIDTDVYAIFKTAKELYGGERHICLSELTDPDLIGDKLLRLIVNSFVVRRYAV